MSKKLFASRVELRVALDAVQSRQPEDAADDDQTELRDALAKRLRDEVAAMNPDNLLVRPSRRAVERFSKQDAWATISPEDKL